MSLDPDRLAGIQYAGIAGSSLDCENAVLQMIQYREWIKHVRILTSEGFHCLLLRVNVGDDLVAIRSGFASGYGGLGPRVLSTVLALLSAHGAEIEEYDVEPEFLERVDQGCLTLGDIKLLDEQRPVRPSRWYDYIYRDDWDLKQDGRLWREFRPVIPFGIVDNRIMDLAISFWDRPDDRLMIAYRRLEDTVRSRIGAVEHGQKLFTKAFVGSESKLHWRDIVDAGEQNGRANLFINAYLAHRNPRAHRELEDDLAAELSEFLLLNHLFRLERAAVERPDPTGSEDDVKGVT